jgi:ESS family glutamate:Na+ symporter
MHTIAFDTFETATIAMFAFFIGKAIVNRSQMLRTYGIPESLIGGFFAAAVVALLHYLARTDIDFDIARRDLFLNYFFAALGLRASVRELLSGWRPLIILVALLTAFLFLQNGVGMAVAQAFELHSKLGIAAGSMALTGRAGTTMAWSAFFEEQFGLSLTRVGFAAYTVGLIAACFVGGPVAKFLIRRHNLATPGGTGDLDVGISHRAPPPQLDYYAFLFALLLIHVAVLLGGALQVGLDHAAVPMPLYILCLTAGVLIGQTLPRIAPKLDWQGSRNGLSLISDVSLGLFYTITLMSLRLWAIEGLIGFIIVLIALQVLLTVAYAVFVVFPLMGRDYQAAVISAGFVGLTLGSTATTMAIMSAVAGEYGRAPQAFVIVPVVCGFFTDIINSVVITLFAML